MKNKINILGGGQTALIAAIMLSNRGYKVEIIDDKPLQQTHFALLRFKTKTIEEETGIKCEEVEIKKAIYYNGQIYNESNIKFDNLYSQKVTGKIQRRSIGNLGIGKRYIPPVDFFDQLISKCKRMDVNYRQIECLGLPASTDDKIAISTLPMPSLYKRVNQEEIKFEFEKVYVVEFNIKNCNVHQTIYYPSNIHLKEPAYRISIIGNNIKCEISEESIKDFYDYDKNFNKTNFHFQKLLENLDTQIYESFGISLPESTIEDAVNECLVNGIEKVIHEQKFGKISPINEQLRQSIIYNLTKQFGIYSLGRFSCWRQIMLDDVVKDVKKIDNMIKLENMTGYEANKTMASL